ncbi:MAG TPA: TPM domain-containing protein [Candidatus Aquilonibacter sp.]|nr:TPM domain-containing protein [Candidatus Aquilonibacter sp.]
MKRLGAFVATALALVLTALPASAAQFVQDGAGMFSAGTIAQLDQRIGAFNAQTGKQILVVTVPSLNGETRQQAAQTVFREQQVNGVLIFIAKAERQDMIMVGTRTAQFFPASTTAQIREAMEAQFKNGDFDGGITTAVSQTLDVFRAHLGSLPNANAPRNYPATTYQRPAPVSNGVHIPVILWIVIIIVGFMIIRSIFRAMGGPRTYGGPGGAPMGGPGYGPGPGYGGPGYYGGGGGGFWSGLLGGLGGAWLGNEMFGGNRGNTIIEQPGTNMVAGDGGGNFGGNAPDPGGWGNDAGQADPGASSGGDWGGGGFGGGDFGGGGGGFGGGDFGGGGGGSDSGGGW